MITFAYLLGEMTPAQRFGAVQDVIRARDWETVGMYTAFLLRELQGAASQSQHRRHPASTDAPEAAPLKPIEERAADFARAYGKR